MISRFIVVGVIAVVMLSAGLTWAAASQHLTIEGDLSFEDLGSYPILPFTVPEGTTSIEVSYAYTWTSTKGDAKGFLDPVLDIGIYDPQKFRGWTGSDLSSFVISESRDFTTDGYAPGEIPSGEWYVELGVGLIYPDMAFHYTVDIDLRDDPVGEPFVWPDRVDVVLSQQARWYLGDLHCHSTHSGKGAPMDEIFDYATSIGLDFVAVTDHNGFSHWLVLGEKQAQYPDLLLLYGAEFTSYRGHANIFNVNRPIDYHGTMSGFDINAVIEGIHHDGGYISPNHPATPFVPMGNSYLGWGWAYPETDWGLVDFYEVVNGPSKVYDVVPNIFNTLAILQWEGLLSSGHKITAIGGSDDHLGGHGSDPLYSPLGAPTTVVYAEELSARGIFEALKAGHVYVIAEGPQGPRIDFTAQCGDRTAMVGDTVTGNYIDFRVEVTGGAGRTLTFWKDGIPWIGHHAVTIDQDPFIYTFTIHALNQGRIRIELHNGIYLSALTNPIYYAPEQAGWQAQHAQASTLLQGATKSSDIANCLMMCAPALGFLIGWKRLLRIQRKRTNH